MHERLSDLIWEAQGETDHDVANRLFVDAEQLAKQILDLEPNDSRATYAIALTWYHRWPPADRQNCVEWLRKTEQIDPDFPWVPLYLGYQFFDAGNYTEAFQQFNRVDREFFASIDHHWRNLKTDELMLVCQIRGELDAPDIATLTKLASNYINADEEDRAVPMEIVNATMAPELRNRFNADPALVAEQVVRLIVGIGDQNVFPDQLAQLQSAAATAG
ncbi:hypothetical protein Poly51_49260 [Rubripirellula tenax]|uniref:Tetratricopeptide repeat protein n=2 Tax=Rubripirellula tenax TaxID=2528015 RepID=A0A5C6EIX0_9BACT|nr:hypothetical protein Poly51_49260 [Rubripirellula tenax]